jgi:hypothetical protein
MTEIPLDRMIRGYLAVRPVALVLGFVHDTSMVATVLVR